MNVLEAREEWKARGKLYSCPNPTHDFEVGRLMGQWTMADDCWSTVTGDGNLRNDFFKIGTVHTLDGYKGYQLILWKFNIIFGVV